MASGGEVGGAEDYTAQGLSSYTCSPCSQNNKTTEAVFYCAECDGCYCKACICDHDLIGRARIHQCGKPRSVHSPQEQGQEEDRDKCLRHPELDVEFYCGDHDVLCCKMCFSTDHRNCSAKKSIENVIQDFSIDEDVKFNRETMAALACSIKVTQAEHRLRILSTETSHQRFVEQIEDFRGKINSIFDNVLKTSAGMKTHILAKIEADNMLCDKYINSVPKYEIMFQEASDGKHGFVGMKKCKEWLKQNEHILKEINSEVRESFELIESNAVDDILTKLTKLGETKIGLSRYSVRTSEDEKECEIVGICQLADGTIVISDTANKRLKVLDDNMTVVSSYDFTNTPRGVTAINETDVAVGMDNQTVEIVHVAENTEVLRTLKLYRDCTNIAFSNNLLHIASNYLCGNSTYCSCKIIIYKYNLLTSNTEGVCHTDYNLRHSTGTTSYPLAFNMDGSHMYTCNSGRYCSVFDNDGKQIKDLFSYQCCNICFNEPDNVYICGDHRVSTLNVKDLSNITQTEVISTSDGIPSTKSIAWNKTVGRLVVGGKCDCLYMV